MPHQQCIYDARNMRLQTIQQSWTRAAAALTMTGCTATRMAAAEHTCRRLLKMCAIVNISTVCRPSAASLRSSTSAPLLLVPLSAKRPGDASGACKISSTCDARGLECLLTVAFALGEGVLEGAGLLGLACAPLGGGVLARSGDALPSSASCRTLGFDASTHESRLQRCFSSCANQSCTLQAPANGAEDVTVCLLAHMPAPT